MKIIIIAAMNEDRVIGKDGEVPWHDPADLKHFKRTTMGHAVIMGRKTFDSIVKPLPGRRNIVITRNAETLPARRDRNAETQNAETLKRRNAEIQNAETLKRRNAEMSASGTSLDFVSSLEAALRLCRERNEEQAYIVGGGQVYRQALAVADEMVITHIEQRGIAGDTFFPEWDPAGWTRSPFGGDAPPHVYVYRRIR